MPGATLLLLFSPGKAQAPTYPTLLKGIHARIADTPGLAPVGTRHFTGLAPDRVAPPYLSLFVVSESFEARNTGYGHVRRVAVQFSLYAGSDDLADSLAEALVAAFSHKADPIRFVGGSTFTMLPMAKHLPPDEGLDASASALRRSIVEAHFLCNRSF